MVKKIYKKIINKIKFLTFILNEKTNGDPVSNQIRSIEKINRKKESLIKSKINNLYQKNHNHPLACYYQSDFNVSHDPERAYEQIKKFDQIRSKWLKDKSLNFLENEFIPTQQVIGSIGNYRALFKYLMYKINIEGSKKKPILLLKDKEKINNNFLYSFFKPHLKIIQNTSLFYKFNYEYNILKTPIEIALPYKNFYYPFCIAENFMLQSMQKLNKPKFSSFKLSDEDYKKGKEILKKMNIPDDAWYVTLHVREGKGHKNRNSNPLTYIKTINEITSRGGFVIRVGDNSMTPLPKVKGLIDYPFTEFKSEFMDVFLAATNRFCLGTSSGYWTISTFFGKPILLVNFLPTLEYFGLSKNILFLPKHLVDKNTKKAIPLENLYSLPTGFIIDDKQYVKKNIKIIDNSEDEILQAAKEMLDILDNKQLNDNFKINNTKFKNLVNSQNTNRFEFPVKAIANVSSSYLNKYLN